MMLWQKKPAREL